MGMWCNMLQLKKRAAQNFPAFNNEVPTLYGYFKDYRPYVNPVMGPPTRPVCETNIPGNYRLSHSFTQVLRLLIEMILDVCVSTEDRHSRISSFNHPNDLTGCVVASIDIISLYPSMDIDFAVEKRIEIICESEVEFREVKERELGLLLKQSMTITT
ncbi:Hypothetical predicted protein [Octopus vulgaris]|uniref:Uncharacterized protein n=1 Tax=Octopus vulgaris TaxID=6645 RepID=A0AA36AM42_OCTVU|nr:Hypothetical predicted protein [Octopus vulgaris]